MQSVIQLVPPNVLPYLIAFAYGVLWAIVSDRIISNNKKGNN